MDFIDLSPQLLISIGLNLSDEELNQLCSLHPELEVKLCSNQEFWQQKYLRDFKRPLKSPLIWKEAYRQRKFNKLLAFGLNESNQLGLRRGYFQLRASPEEVPLDEKIIKISAGHTHSLILTNNGEVYGSGANEYGQLGLGDKHTRWKFVRIPLKLTPEEKIISISAGGLYSLILTENGEVYAFGVNEKGQLGLGDQRDRWKPERIPLKEKIVAISAGYEHSLILTENGSVYSSGFNEKGQLGLGDTQNRLNFEQISFEKEIVIISAGDNYSLILTKNGEVYAFGDNDRGQLGLGDRQNQYRPKRILFEEGIISISAGKDHSLMLTKNGEVYAFGSGYSGQLGVGDMDDRYFPVKIRLNEKIIAIAAGNDHNLILTEDGFVYSFGNNFYGQLGLGDIDNRLRPQRIPLTEKIIKISTGGGYSLILTGEDALFSSIQTLIQNEWIKNTELKYWTSENTAVFEFIDLQDEFYPIEIHYDSKTNQIFELK